MIRREDDNHWLLISQLQHARIAAELATAWDAEKLLSFPHRDELLSAIRHHDDGWAAWELAPTINERGEPRDFTEMPMPVATSIWTRCIDACTSHSVVDSVNVDMFNEFGAYLRARGLRFTKERQAIVGKILEMSGEMNSEQLSEQLNSGREQRVSRSTIYRTISQLEAAGIIERVNVEQSGELWRVCSRTQTLSASASMRRTRSEHGGLWVSRHFSYLADRARDSRDSTSDIEAISAFLSQQSNMQHHWRERLESTAEDAQTTEEFGFRWLQTFDRISLWLCCTDRNQSWQLALPSETETTFTPIGNGTISVDPFPFSGPIRLTVESARLPQQTFQNDEQLTPNQFPQHTIVWQLIPLPD